MLALETRSCDVLKRVLGIKSLLDRKRFFKGFSGNVAPIKTCHDKRHFSCQMQNLSCLNDCVLFVPGQHCIAFRVNLQEHVSG